MDGNAQPKGTLVRALCRAVSVRDDVCAASVAPCTVEVGDAASGAAAAAARMESEHRDTGQQP